MMIRTDDDKNILPCQSIITDLNLQVRNQIDDSLEEHCSCDSEYMLTAMNKVGKSIRAAYYWVLIDQKCYLVMDNADSHGTAGAIEEYKNNLLTNYNIEIILQISRSPYTNVVDLGVWVLLQSIVKSKHILRCCTTQALLNTVNQTWKSLNLDQMLINMFGRIKVVLCNILKGGGGNILVEEARGVKYRNVKIREMQGSLDDEVADLQDVNLELNVKENNDKTPFEEETV